jgi:hypothetical protein
MGGKRTLPLARTLLACIIWKLAADNPGAIRSLKAERCRRIKANLRYSKGNYCFSRVLATGPVTPHDLCHKLPSTTLNFEKITHYGRRTVEPILVFAQLSLRDNLARLQCDALDPIAHSNMLIANG